MFQLQVASLVSLKNSHANQEYVSHLEEALASVRTQLETFTKRCQELEKVEQTETTPTYLVRTKIMYFCALE